jgi:predicted nucleotidyltransferase
MPRLEPTRLQLAAQHLALLRELLQTHVPQTQVWAYGSRVSGGAHEGSDLDLVLRNPAQLSASCEGWMDLKEALQASTLPILVDVHDWAHLPAEFHWNIEREYVELQTGENYE